jgi:hypothetical protein
VVQNGLFGRMTTSNGLILYLKSTRKSMKTLLVVSCILLLFLPGRQCAQCFSDTLVPFTVLTYSLDSAAICGFPYTCPGVQMCHYWQLPDSFKGGVFIYNHGQPFEVIVLDSCRWVIMDTCVTIDSFPDGFQLHHNFPLNASLAVCGGASEPIQADIKPDPTGLLNNFGPRKMDLDTLCATGRFEQSQSEANHRLYYALPITCNSKPIRGDQRLSNTNYKVARIPKNGEMDY